MKLFEIGDGLKSILVNSKYYSDWENENNVFIYTGEEDEATIRISVISVIPNNQSDKEYYYHQIIKEGESKNIPVTTIQDKSYYTYSEEYPSEETPLVCYFYEIGYKWNIIIISVTANLENKDNPAVKNTLREIEEFIPTIQEISEEKTTLFEPKYTDFVQINKRITEVLEIEENDINTYHENGQTLKQIQQLLDKQAYEANQSYELQSLGIAMGDYIQYKYPSFHWAVAKDEYGRDICLQYKNLAVQVFPMTMILKRVEDNIQFEVEELVQELISKVEETVSSGTFTELDHNY